MDRLEEQISFLLEIDKQKEIIRQTYLADGSRKETRRGTCLAYSGHVHGAQRVCQ